MTPKIELSDVHKSFGPKQVLDGISLTVAKGESLVIIGGSGTGKSVLLKCILGLHAPDSGTIRIDGEDVTGVTGKARERLMHKFGMLFQGGALFDSLTVWENVTFAVRQSRKLDKLSARSMAIDKLASVGLGPEVADLKPAELSGGMQKRVALARAICADPDIIFFDEPTTGLDPIMADVINDLIIKCTRDLGLTTLSITHDMASACKIANQVAMMYQGKIIWSGRAQEIYHSKNLYVDQFVHGRAHGPITDEREAAAERSPVWRA
jgi:phospholipid/cholesterol/gamma-HCH transport system ATP-binding protein